MATFEGHIIMYSSAALLFQGVYWHGAVWFPVSQTRVEDDDIENNTVVIHVNDWLPKKRGMLEFTEYQAEELEAMNAI